MKKRLESYINNASTETIDHGMQWYSNAYNHCKRIALKYNVTPVMVASVIAALSPRNRWSRNLIDAENVISHVFNNTPLQKCAVFGAMRNKALTLCNLDLTLEQREKILNGRKIQSFFLNILGAKHRVTIDSWIDLAYSGKYKPTKKRNNLTLTRYKKIENDFLNLSKKYNVEAYKLQAIVWLQFQKEINNNGK